MNLLKFVAFFYLFILGLWNGFSVDCVFFSTIWMVKRGWLMGY